MSLTPKPSKREWLRNKLRPTSPLPSRPGATLSRKPSQTNASPAHRCSVLEDALLALGRTIGREEEETIRALLPSGAVNVKAAFDGVHGCATQLQQRCASKTLRWIYKGRQIYVHDQVDKVLHFLDKFKSAGDIVANVDPVHIGLPWAGIRVILEVSIRPKTLSFLLHSDSYLCRSPCPIATNVPSWSLGWSSLCM